MQVNNSVLLTTKRWKYRNVLPSLIFLVMALSQCADSQASKEPAVAVSTTIEKDQLWCERMAQSIMKRNPRAWQLEGRETRKWSYTHGLVSLAFLELWEHTGESRYYEFAKGYADDMINEEGEIYNYHIDEFNIDHVNPGKILFPLYEKTKDRRYKKAMETLRTQLEWQPRNTKGGFWHKLRYPWQMWLDGLYMGSPFYAQYAAENNQPEAFDDIANQFITMEKYARDEETGLLYHGWDESKVQRWANKETGCSPHFWGRSLGWYAMGLVDALDYFPEDHPKRQNMIDILNRLATAVTKYQDDETGLWYQVVDMGGEEGNYLEATVSSMLSYSFFKAVRKGYLDESYRAVAEKAFHGLIDNLIEVTDEGEVHIHKCCAVAGLGGDPYRDGSYEYYINEQIRSNDPKATGPFILASIEYEMLNKNQE